MKILRYIRANRFFCGVMEATTPSQSQGEPQPTHRPCSEKRTRLQLCGGALACAALALLCPTPARATLANYQTAVTNETSLISYYTFDQNNAADVRGTNSGMLMGTTAFAAGIGGAGKALLLDGTGRVNLGAVQDFVFDDTTGSAEAWVQAGNLGGVNATIFANQDGATRWAIHMNGDKSGIGMWNGGAYFPTINIPNPSTNWHHLVTVFDGGSWTVYWDGALAGSFTRPLGFTDPIVATEIGSTSSSANAEAWVGMLDEVAFYADALTPETVLAHYQAFFAGAPPVITKQPLGGTYLPGVARTLSVKATGSGLAYQWYIGTTALTGKTDTTLSFPSLGPSDVGTYSVIVTNVGGSVTSAPAMIALSSSLPGALVRYQTAISNETSLISYYTFDRLTPTDVVGPNNGTLAGTADWGQGMGGGPGQGLLLDGSGHIQLGSVPDFDFASGSGTVEGWVRADWTSVSGYPCMFADRDGPTVWSLHLSSDKTTLTFYNGINSLGYTVPGGGAGTNWHHVAMVFDGGTGTYYWDGAFVGTRTNGFGTGPATVQLGSSAGATTAEGWIGMLDEVAFYSAALPVTSIQAHYNAYFQGTPPVITAQPVGGYFLAGQPFQTSVAASGAQLSYQWYKDGTPIPTATNAIIGSASLTPANSGAYYVRVSNGAGGTNSATVTVQVGNNMARYQATVLAEGSLLSYYTFDAGDGRDARNAHPGTVANTVAFGAGAGGVTNQCLTLLGTGHIDLGQVADFDFTSGSGTAEGWIRPDWSTAPGYAPCVFADRDGGSVWSIHMTEGKNAIGNWNGDRFQTMTIPTASGWHHYAIVFNTGHVAMYWDGRPIGTFAQAINFSSGKTTQIGSSAPTTTGEGWVGGLDEVAFYSTALGPDAIWNHFLAMVGPDTAPKLSYSLAGKQLTLFWPTDVTGFTLEYAVSLPAASWTPVSGVVNNQVTVDASSGMRFFRLRK
jgi:Concanavalin A-like lectin/glucanases superfamily/Immunoglobulin domain